VSKAPPPLNRNEKGEKLSPDEAEEKVERLLQGDYRSKLFFSASLMQGRNNPVFI
jgi:hypothetical protein